MNILLLGLMGSGKSTIGQILAKELNLQFVESDSNTLAHTGGANVHEIYENRVSLWKESELEIMRKLSEKENQVIACGGGVAENELNFQYFKENSVKTIIIYLNATPKVLSKRIALNHKDSSISDASKIQANIEKHFEKRDFLYKIHANLAIETSQTQPSEVIEKILAYLGSK